mmetsp:Transcript_13373/g.15506  ORF Transcript_13373/g.15506 Transcript_13373/m.15506 type:complete len:153 (-) Transcript_13373:1246-1704(-)
MKSTPKIQKSKAAHTKRLRMEANSMLVLLRMKTMRVPNSSDENTDKSQLKIVDNSAIQDLGVPKFLVNKWLNIQAEKSKFSSIRCQVDNKDDVSVYSETTQPLLSSKLVESALLQESSKVLNLNFEELVMGGQARDRSSTYYKKSADINFHK